MALGAHARMVLSSLDTVSDTHGLSVVRNASGERVAQIILVKIQEKELLYHQTHANSHRQ